ncbi:MAG: NAD(P)H-binding protein [Actinomycetes bacterium]|jgi:putative NADH-flavin reductase|nr:MAG: hypothetical protein DIU67_00290 [Actinomycetota bacterium]
MPLIVVGADTPAGRRILDGFSRDGEVRAFVTSPEDAERLRSSGVKVALGDVSDDSHVEMACYGCFSAVLVMEAATDDRERSFARDSRSVVESWARAVATAGVQRVIWVGSEEPPATRTPEVAVVDPSAADLSARIAELDRAGSI